MSAKHTPEVVAVQTANGLVVGINEWTRGTHDNGQVCVKSPRGMIATMEAGSDPIRVTDADRIVKCVNAFQGVEDPAAWMLANAAKLEAARVALTEFERYFTNRPGTDQAQYLTCAVRALALIGGAK